MVHKKKWPPSCHREPESPKSPKNIEDDVISCACAVHWLGMRSSWRPNPAATTITVDTIGLTNGTIGTTNGTIGTNVSTNGNICTSGTIGYRETFRVLWLPMVPLATNYTIGKISNGTIGRIPNARYISLLFRLVVRLDQQAPDRSRFLFQPELQ